ncbi:MAG: nucleotidyltransferase domain-containing protein [Bacillota bacterium]|nr:nucleotidyltransferase domain-containing protein [Bacillota bacterium]
MFGLTANDMCMIIEAVKKFPEIEEVVIFGSRALGNYKKGSDVDLAIKGAAITKKTLFGLNDLLNEVYPLPYFFDILHYDTIKNPKLIEHIDDHGLSV